MAGDWIKMRTNLDTDPRVIAIGAELNLPELHVVGMLWKVWSWADAHSIDGNAIRVTDVTLDRFTSVTGFAAALRKAGWLEGRDNALTFPRFAEHNGHTAKNRAETKVRVAKHRNGKAVTDVTQKLLPEKRREDSNKQIDIAPADDFAGQALDPSKWNLPDSWRTGELLAAMSGWQSHLSQTHSKKFLEIHAVQLCQKHHAWGPEKLARALRESIVAGAKNVFDPDDQRKPAGGYSGNRSQVVKGLT